MSPEEPAHKFPVLSNDCISSNPPQWPYAITMVIALVQHCQHTIENSHNSQSSSRRMTVIVFVTRSVGSENSGRYISVDSSLCHNHLESFWKKLWFGVLAKLTIDLMNVVEI